MNAVETILCLVIFFLIARQALIFYDVYLSHREKRLNNKLARQSAQMQYMQMQNTACQHAMNMQRSQLDYQIQQENLAHHQYQTRQLEEQEAKRLEQKREEEQKKRAEIEFAKVQQKKRTLGNKTNGSSILPKKLDQHLSRARKKLDKSPFNNA